MLKKVSVIGLSAFLLASCSLTFDNICYLNGQCFSFNQKNENNEEADTGVYQLRAYPEISYQNEVYRLLRKNKDSLVYYFYREDMNYLERFLSVSLSDNESLDELALRKDKEFSERNLPYYKLDLVNNQLYATVITAKMNEEGNLVGYNAKLEVTRVNSCGNLTVSYMENNYPRSIEVEDLAARLDALQPSFYVEADKVLDSYPCN